MRVKEQAVIYIVDVGFCWIECVNLLNQLQRNKGDTSVVIDRIYVRKILSPPPPNFRHSTAPEQYTPRVNVYKHNYYVEQKTSGTYERLEGKIKRTAV